MEMDPRELVLKQLAPNGERYFQAYYLFAEIDKHPEPRMEELEQLCRKQTYVNDMACAVTAVSVAYGKVYAKRWLEVASRQLWEDRAVVTYFADYIAGVLMGMLRSAVWYDQQCEPAVGTVVLDLLERIIYRNANYNYSDHTINSGAVQVLQGKVSFPEVLRQFVRPPGALQEYRRFEIWRMLSRLDSDVFIDGKKNERLTLGTFILSGLQQQVFQYLSPLEARNVLVKGFTRPIHTAPTW